ncbi:MAG: hypothetical protein ACRDNO_17695 [Trebonia sp.]
MAAVAAAALPAVAARMHPEAAVTSTLPAANVTAVRRARANPISMSRPIACRFCHTSRCGALNAHIESQNAMKQTVLPWLDLMNMQ